jgi:hypothetical protein
LWPRMASLAMANTEYFRMLFRWPRWQPDPTGREVYH